MMKSGEKQACREKEGEYSRAEIFLPWKFREEES
jgi:hypothetical protein